MITFFGAQRSAEVEASLRKKRIPIQVAAHGSDGSCERATELKRITR